MPSKFVEYLKRAETGPLMEEEDFDLRVYWPAVKKLAAECDLRFDPEMIVPTDDGMLDRMFEAATELLVRVGIYCTNSQRVIEFQRDEVQQALGLLPREVSLGEGRDAVHFRPRTLEPKEPPRVLARVLGPQSDDILDKVYLSFAKEPLIDMVHLQGTDPLFEGVMFQSGSPLELLKEIDRIGRARNALRKAGRPGLHDGATAFPSLNSVLIACNPEWGIRRGDARHAMFQPQMKTNYEHLCRALAAVQNGFHVTGVGYGYLGAMAGGPTTTALTILAETIAAAVLYRPTAISPGGMDVRFNTQGNRPAFWCRFCAAAAFIKRTGYGACTISHIVSAGPCCAEFYWEIAAYCIGATACGTNVRTGTGWMSRKRDGAVGLSGRFAGEVGRAATGLSRIEANALINRIMPRYEDRIVDKTIDSLGKSFRECYDLERVEPTAEHLEVYRSVKRELSRMGLRIDPDVG